MLPQYALRPSPLAHVLCRTGKTHRNTTYIHNTSKLKHKLIQTNTQIKQKAMPDRQDPRMRMAMMQGMMGMAPPAMQMVIPSPKPRMLAPSFRYNLMRGLY